MEGIIYNKPMKEIVLSDSDARVFELLFPNEERFYIPYIEDQLRLKSLATFYKGLECDRELERVNERVCSYEYLGTHYAKRGLCGDFLMSQHHFYIIVYKFDEKTNRPIIEGLFKSDIHDKMVM